MYHSRDIALRCVFGINHSCCNVGNTAHCQLVTLISSFLRCRNEIRKPKMIYGTPHSAFNFLFLTVFQEIRETVRWTCTSRSERNVLFHPLIVGNGYDFSRSCDFPGFAYWSFNCVLNATRSNTFETMLSLLLEIGRLKLIGK